METVRNSAPSSGITVEIHERIRRRAEEIYVQSGRVPGRDVENWSQAEREILAETEKEKEKPHLAVVIKVNGTRYVGEYQPDSSDGYSPGEFAVGSSVAVRLERGKMFIKRPNGKELETRIIKRID